MIAQIDTSGLELMTTGAILMENTIESSGRFAKMEQDSINQILPIFSQASLSKRDATVGFHTHPGIELIYFSAGKASIFIGAQEYFLSGGNIICNSPGIIPQSNLSGKIDEFFHCFFSLPEAL